MNKNTEEQSSKAIFDMDLRKKIELLIGEEIIEPVTKGNYGYTQSKLAINKLLQLITDRERLIEAECEVNMLRLRKRWKEQQKELLKKVEHYAKENMQHLHSKEYENINATFEVIPYAIFMDKLASLRGQEKT